MYAPSGRNMNLFAVLTVCVLNLPLAGIYRVFTPQFFKNHRVKCFFNATDHIIYQKKLWCTDFAGIFTSDRRTLHRWERFILPNIELLNFCIGTGNLQIRENFIPGVLISVGDNIVHTVIVHSGNVPTMWIKQIKVFRIPTNHRSIEEFLDSRFPGSRN